MSWLHVRIDSFWTPEQTQIQLIVVRSALLKIYGTKLAANPMRKKMSQFLSNIRQICHTIMYFHAGFVEKDTHLLSGIILGVYLLFYPNVNGRNIQREARYSFPDIVGNPPEGVIDTADSFQRAHWLSRITCNIPSVP